MQYPQYQPASDNRPLSDEELDELDGLLAELPTEAGMNIEALDGYLAGLLLAPRPLAGLPGSAWLPQIWGGDGADPLPFRSGKQRKKAVLLVLRHLQSIAMSWAHQPQAWEPIFSMADGEDEDTEYADAEDWAAGFLMAANLDPEGWGPRFEAPALAALLEPIVLLGSDPAELAEADRARLADAAGRDALSRAIPDKVLALHQHLGALR